MVYGAPRTPLRTAAVLLTAGCGRSDQSKRRQNMMYPRCIKGTRIPVHQIIHMLANGDTIEELLTEYPSLEREDILTCLDYAASLAEEQVTPIAALASAT
jgi:uncharacterized protein (DUF433 family)